jgi:hypothetical protein
VSLLLILLVFLFVKNPFVTILYDYSKSQLLITNPVFQEEIITCNINLVTVWMHSLLYSFSCLHEVEECIWDVNCAKSQKSEDPIYTAKEAWKHSNSKYVLLFDSACSWACSSTCFLIFLVGFHLYSTVCSAINWQFYSFLKLCCVSLATFLFLGKELIYRSNSLLFVPCLLLCRNYLCDAENRLWKRCL